ncbi:protein of unknown function [Methylacidimicrobium sp. AP8]|nr:protein of unknown function [Methylacidimicrobium sp. AP8]
MRSSKRLPIVKAVKEVASGLNGHRKGMIGLLRDPKVGVILVEHRDRLMRFGLEYVEAASVRAEPIGSSGRSGRDDRRYRARPARGHRFDVCQALREAIRPEPRQEGTESDP